MSMITPEYVQTLQGPTDGFLCNIEDNIYGIEFTAFKIRSIDEVTNTSTTHFEVRGEEDEADSSAAAVSTSPPEDPDECRKVRYNFGPAFLNLRTIGTELEFVVKGSTEVRDLRMIERHYFRDQCIKSYDFTMPYAMPSSRNTWEIIYTMPEEILTEELKSEIRNAHWETKSDSFYFVAGQLIMHNKAEYNYS